MEPQTSSQRLSSVSTLWSVVLQANEGPAATIRAAQQKLLERYGGAIRRYLLGALRDEDAAEELFQEFALCLLQGKLGGVDPDRGRFRDFVKGVLCHLVTKYHKRRQRRPQPLGSHEPVVAGAAPTYSGLDDQFLASWRDDLLTRSWSALSQSENETGQPFYTVLRFRAEHPDLSSGQMAQQLSTDLGKPLTAPAVRQMLHRARARFAGLLLEEVTHSLDQPTDEQLEQELLELGLLEHCRPALVRARRPRPGPAAPTPKDETDHGPVDHGR
jgi:RNA polymerase sigma-70 factor (ECF subfamily)